MRDFNSSKNTTISGIITQRVPIKKEVDRGRVVFENRIIIVGYFLVTPRLGLGFRLVYSHNATQIIKRLSFYYRKGIGAYIRRVALEYFHDYTYVVRSNF